MKCHLTNEPISKRNGSSRMERNSFYILSFGFTFSTLNFKFPSTLVENPLQITPFYAKQTQFPKKSNDVIPYNTTDYKRKRNWTLGENKPNSNPIKPNLRKAKMNINSITTKDYRKKMSSQSKKTNPIQTHSPMRIVEDIGAIKQKTAC